MAGDRSYGHNLVNLALVTRRSLRDSQGPSSRPVDLEGTLGDGLNIGGRAGDER